MLGYESYFPNPSIYFHFGPHLKRNKHYFSNNELPEKNVIL